VQRHQREEVCREARSGLLLGAEQHDREHDQRGGERDPQVARTQERERLRSGARDPHDRRGAEPARERREAERGDQRSGRDPRRMELRGEAVQPRADASSVSAR
jgi:hypothetical protein